MDKLRRFIENVIFFTIIGLIIVLVIFMACVIDSHASVTDEDVVFIVKNVDADKGLVQVVPIHPVLLTLSSSGASLSTIERGASMTCRGRTVERVNGSHLELRCKNGDYQVFGMDFNAH